MKVRDLLKKGIDELNQQKIEDAVLKVRMLLMYELKIKNEQLVLWLEKEMPKEKEILFFQDLQKLVEGVPFQYVTNFQTFYGLDFYVNSDVLIPQPDTEVLVEKVIDIAHQFNQRVKILDMCTGSGAIAIALAKYTNSEVVAVDISKEALKIAQKNVRKNEVKIEILQSDMFEKVTGKFDIIVSNPPYIETEVLKTLSKEVKNEPKIALDGGEDGLKFYRILVEKSQEYLKKEGFLAVEIGFDQKEKVMKLFEEYGFCDIKTRKDLGNNDRVVSGKWTG